jgi:hypothetical protein
MTFYVILEYVDNDWKVISEPQQYLVAKSKVQELRRKGGRYRLLKTSY